MQIQSGYREIEHTADWELEVWAPDLTGLLEQAARGMYALTGTKLRAGPRIERRIELDMIDEESLLVGFLSELLYIGEMEGLGFDRFHLRLDGSRLDARLDGAPLESMSKEIKAVTYHNLRIEKSQEGLRARVVFDV